MLAAVVQIAIDYSRQSLACFHLFFPISCSQVLGMFRDLQQLMRAIIAGRIASIYVATANSAECWVIHSWRILYLSRGESIC